MISGAGLPAYNRFDKIPTHALQCGIPPADSILRYGSADVPDLQYNTGNDQRQQTLDSTGSRYSLDSTTSSQESSRNSNHSATWGSDKTSPYEQEVVAKFEHDLYVEKTSPPPYNSRHSSIDRNAPSRESLPKKSKAAQEIVALLKKTESEKNSFGSCHGCNGQINAASEACEAMGQIYHNKCFTCCACGRTLREKAFYCVQGKTYCEEDYMYSGFQQTIEKCFHCGHLIMDMGRDYTEILQAMGKSFHPGCFRCTECNKCLDGIPFTIDVNNKVYCVKDFHKLFAPKCAACEQAIIPIDGSDETVRVVALDRDYHIDCYQCERCKMQLTDEPEKRCYPIGRHLFCYDCHIQVRTISLPSPSASSTSSSHSSSSHMSSRPANNLTNGQVKRRKPPSPLTTPSGLLRKTIPEELPQWAKPDIGSNVNSRLQVKRPEHLELAWTNEIATLPSDPNQRLQEKIKQHLTANQEYKQKLRRQNSSNATLTTVNLRKEVANTQLVHQPISQPGTTRPFKSEVTFTPQLDSRSQGQSAASSNWQADKPAHYTTTVAHSPREYNVHAGVSRETSREVAEHKDNSQGTPPRPAPVDSHSHVAPRAAPVDLAVPLPNTKRHGTPRRRLPLSDIIMHKKIAESLRKTLASGTRYPSPDAGFSTSSSSHSGQPSSNTHTARLAKTRSPSPPPHYMKAWHASEVARSASTTAPLAVPQEPVTSQQLPPRLVARGVDNPPGRPPKLKSLQITKI